MNLRRQILIVFVFFVYHCVGMFLGDWKKLYTFGKKILDDMGSLCKTAEARAKAYNYTRLSGVVECPWTTNFVDHLYIE